MPAADIIAKIPGQYQKAKESGDLLFFPSTVIRHRESGIDIEFQVRVCPAIAKKPQNTATASGQPEQKDSPSVVTNVGSSPAAFEEGEKPKFDPFVPPYNENLYVGELKDERFDGDFVVILNKFSVVPNHFLLVTREYKPQTLPLLPADLVQSYQILQAARNTGRRIFAFYNSGDFSGASQSHKHIQFIPVEETELGPPIERLARSVNVETPAKPFTISSLPYANHVFRFPSDLVFEENSETLEFVLAQAFIALIDLGISTIRHAPDYPPGNPSYNVIITLEHMHLIPRRHETFTLPETGDVISVNSLGYAGMLLVKTDEELERVKSHGIGKILQGVGLQSVHDVQVAGVTDEAVDAALAHIYSISRYNPSVHHSQHKSALMSPSAWTPLPLRASNTHFARAENSSEIASLGGKPAKTPIIAGSVCGGVLFLAWTIGFSIYFRKRYQRKQLKRAAAAIGMPPPEVKSRPQMEKIVIPPDPAVLLGQRQPGYASAEATCTHTVTSERAATGAAGTMNTLSTSPLHMDSGVGSSGSGPSANEEHVEERRPLLKVMTGMPDISALQRPRGMEKVNGADVSGTQ
ncbi:5',5'''-P-1,P-4-tetraphosphate phosphorylase 2 [Leucoagaricus sp. SymC.cos]|nr:5',5'''-P-1,P-4-tetraphosphate phosphorylase 2 [Leucoagaricus sp. SymC.cos]